MSLRSDFHRGFLPNQDPLQRLPEGDHHEFNFNIWLNLQIENLPAHMRAKSLRITVDILNKKFSETSVPMVNIDRNDPREVNQAIAILTTLIQAYVWEDRAKPARIIPRILSENMYDLLRYNPRVPVLTYADYVLQNFRRLDASKAVSLDNVEPLYMFTGSTEEAWFIKIHVAVEAAFAEAIDAACKINELASSHGCEDDKNDLFAQHFTVMAQSIGRATEVVTRMYEACSPEFFYHVLRPYLEGTDKAEGIIFDLRSDKGAQHPVKYRGSSGAQSSTVPALDAILNVKHKNDAMNQTLQAFVEYMPNRDKALILSMKNHHVPDSAERRQAIAKLWLFREAHKKMPTRYISMQAVKAGIKPSDVTGTGSTNIGMFLTKRADDTREAAIKGGGFTPVAKL